MFPVLTILYPDLARSAAQYRFDRLVASEANAAASGYDGASWAWESAATGLWTSIDHVNDVSENHISADIPLAHRRYFLATGDLSFLSDSWPTLNSTCRFWACRFTRLVSI